MSLVAKILLSKANHAGYFFLQSTQASGRDERVRLEVKKSHIHVVLTMAVQLLQNKQLSVS